MKKENYEIHYTESIATELIEYNIRRKHTTRTYFVCLFVFLALRICGCIFHNPVAGFSLLVFEVS
jgi:hypothetical protein